MKFLFIFASLAILAVSASGQDAFYRIEGNVTDVNGPVAGATVTITSVSSKVPQETTVTNETGHYRLAILPGQYFLRAKRVVGRRSFLSGENSIEAVAGGNQIVNFTIPFVGISEFITVSADDAQPLDEVSKTVNVIGGQEMRDRADITLVDSLRTIPGFRVQQLGGFGRVATVKSRGLRNHDTAILIDGVRFRDATAITGDASPFLSDFTLTSVSRIEVLRGPGSSLYGTNAVGGTIDFQTPRPQQGWHGQASGAGGGLGFGRFRGNVSYGTRDVKYGFNTGVSRTIFTKGIDGNDEAKNTNFQGRFDAKPSSRTSISARFFFSDAYVQLNTDPDTFGTLPPTNATIINAIEGVNFFSDPNDPDRTQDSDFFNGQIVVNHAFSEKLDLQAYYSGLKTKRTNKNGVLGTGFQSASTNVFDGQIHTANARLRWTPNRVNTLTFGYEFEKEKFGNDGFTPGGFGDFFTRAGQSSNTIFVNDLVSAHDGRLQISGGFRAQFFTLDEPRFSETNAPYSDLVLESPASAVTFDGSASYYFSKSGTKLRTHIGSGYRVPSLYERFGSFFNSFGPPPFIAIGDPYLEPEKTWAFDAGIDQSIADGKARLSAVYFYSKLDRTIGYGNVAPDIDDTERPFGGYINTEGGTARGAEFSGKFEPTKSTDIFTSYTYTKSEQNVPQVSGSGILTTLGIPKNQFTLLATQRFGNFWVNFDLLVSGTYLGNIFQSSFPFGSYVYRFKGNRRGDLTAGYTFPVRRGKFNLRVSGTVENLFGNQYFENGFRTIGRTARAGANFSF